MFRKNRINIKGFTLIEVLVVLSIIAVIVAFTIPAMAPALKGSNLRQAADQLEALLAGAHQRAITENRPVEVRFFRFEDPETPGSLPMYRAVQAAQVITNPQDHTDVKFEEEEVQMIPQPFVLAEKSYSTIVESEALREDATKIPRRELAEFVAFEFRPDGSTNLATVDESHWTLTVMRETDLNRELTPATEFITLVLDPFNGRIRRLQP
ncbi:MAG: Verru_Chthon cassette protein D [Verrucomicrobiota bacterium]|nr:Verru_Chthon cassette protein D [Verrucomicrobiota bacterium]